MRKLTRFLKTNGRQLCWATAFDLACFAAAFFAGTRCHAQQPYILAPVPAQPVSVAHYCPVASFLRGAPTYSYHVAYVLRPVAPPAAVPPVPAQPVGGQP